MQRVNCAIYVRKSTEKGLEQEFNSLHNQEEACKNYILSQAFNGWEYFKTYEDGGISGGTMKRPGLNMMLSDMKKGLIQVVVVYKVDRLSRSIIDFHNMMKEFEEYGCSFVSITQAFDTSNSMGKLTLNMLLSFAQFEREVSAERIRDKIAATKKKGLWTGGCPPLGYDLSDKKLISNPKEAEHVRFIFEKYVELKSLIKLRKFLLNTDVRTKKWTSETGLKKGGRVFSRSMLARILRSQIYIGRIENKKDGVSYPGKHQAIVESKIFNQVQSLLDGNRKNKLETYSRDSFLLSGKIFDESGKPFKNEKGTKNKVKKYRYYAQKGRYLPAGDFEDITFEVVKDLLNCSLNKILEDGQALDFKQIDFDGLTLRKQADLIRAMISRIIYHDEKLTYFINVDDLTYLRSFGKKDYINAKNDESDARIYLAGDKKNLVVEKDILLASRPSTNQYIGDGKKIITVSGNNTNLIKALSVGWRYGKMLEEGKSIRQIGTEEKRADRTIYKYLNLNYLSPNIVNSVMDSEAPAHINMQALFNIASKYPDFNDQEGVFYCR